MFAFKPLTLRHPTWGYSWGTGLGGGSPRSVGVPSKKGQREPMVLSQVVNVGVDFPQHKD